MPVGNTLVSAMSEQSALLRRSWRNAANSIAPELTTLPDFLEDSLISAEGQGLLTEVVLENILREASKLIDEALPRQTARTLEKQWRRTLYEYLLALDALNDERNEVEDTPLEATGLI